MYSLFFFDADEEILSISILADNIGHAKLKAKTMLDYMPRVHRIVIYPFRDSEIANRVTVENDRL